MKKCEYCSGAIDEKEKHCTLTSYSKGEKVHEDSWHAECWRTRWEEKMDKKVREYAELIKAQAMPLIKAKMGMVA
jgi:hypothetical protein